MMPSEEKRTESGSSLGVWKSCPKKYYFQIEQRLQPKGFSQSLAFGSLVHANVAMINSGMAETFIAERNQLIQSLHQEHPDHVMEIGLAQELAVFVANEWNLHWSADVSPKSKSALEFIDIETEWRFELPSGFHVGKRDGLVRHREYGGLFLYELKTASRRDQAGYVESLQVDQQINSNLLALRKAGLEVQGVIYDIIWKPAIILKAGRKTMPDETLPEYNQRLMAEYKAGNCFQRESVNRTLAHLAEYEQELEAQFYDLEHQAVRYRNSGACKLYNRTCPYQEICIPGAPTELRDAFKVREKKLQELA